MSLSATLDHRLDDVLSQGVVPVVAVSDSEHAVPLGAALARGGLRAAEVTLRHPSALDSLHAMAGAGDVVVGAGTVLDADQVDLAVDAGARFVVSPGTSREVVERCRDRGVPVLPGVASPTDLMLARSLDIGLVKLFPAQALGGLAMLTALAAPFPGTEFVPTGGLGEADLAEWLGYRYVRAVGGSWITATPLVRARDWDEVTRRASAALATATSALEGR